MRLKYFKEHLEQPISFPTNKDEVENNCLFYDIQNYSINDDLTIDVHAGVDLSGQNIVDVIFVKFNKVEGEFDVSGNYIKTLEGWFPKEVDEFIEVSNNNLTSLKGIPKICNGSFYCNENDLTSLEGCPEEIRGTFDMSDNKIESFEYCAKIINGNIIASYNNIKSLKGIPPQVNKLYLQFNKLKNLENCPDVESSLIINDCYLESLKGFKSTSGRCKITAKSNNIESIEGIEDVKLHTLNLERNSLTNLKGCPQNINELIVQHNNLTSLEGCPKSIDKINVSINELTSLKGGPEVIKVSGDFSYNKIINLEGCPKGGEESRINLFYNPIGLFYRINNIAELNLLNTFKVIKGNDVYLKRLKYLYTILGKQLTKSDIEYALMKIKDYYNIIE